MSLTPTIKVHVPPLGTDENAVADSIIEEIIREEDLTKKGGSLRLPAGRRRDAYRNVTWGRPK